MKYILDKKIFYVNLLICVLLVGTIIYFEGMNVVKTRTETISCPDQSMTCKVLTPQGEYIELTSGEEITINKFNQKNLNIANYGVWTLISIAAILNHMIYNRKYPIKKEIKKLFKKIKDLDID